MEFLGYIIFGYGIHMDPYKVQTIVDCVILDYVQDVQCFLEVINFYQRFITHYFSILAPLIWLIRKDQPFSWGVEVENAFQSLKDSFTIIITRIPIFSN